MKINIKKLTTTAKIPTRGSEYAAGYDLYADITKELVIEPHETAKIGTGLSIEIPDGYFGAVFARSGLAAKQALRPANCVGVCDSDYRGEYIVALHNDGTQARTINPGDRIAQLVVMPYLAVEFNEVSELSTLRRERSDISNRIRRPKSPEEQIQNKERRKAVSKQMKPIRERLRRAERILEKSPHLYELLKQEHELEKKARARHKERGR